MTVRRTARALASPATVAAAVLVLAACGRNSKVIAPEPALKPDVDTLPSLPRSMIEAPITYDLTPVLASLEAAVPKTFGNIAERKPHPTNKRVHFAFAAEREPFALRLDGDTVRMTAIINYSGRVWYNAPLLPEVSASCGADGVKPRARIELVTPLRLTPDWKLRSSTAVRVVEPVTRTERDQCEVTAINVDVTGRVIDAARKLLANNTQVVDAKVASLDIRSKFEEWWSIIQKPIRLTDTVWLAINPIDVHVGKAQGTRRTLQTGVTLTAEPRIIAGRKPEIVPRPLPRQIDQKQNNPGNFHVLLEGVLHYEVASKLLTEELRGEKVGKAGQSIEVRSVRMFGVGDGKIALQVDFDGDAKGRVYFLGTPVYDYAADRLYVPDLEYDVATANMLVRGLTWLKHDDLKQYLRGKARWPVGGLLKQAHEQLESALNRELAPGVRLSGAPAEITVIGVHAGKECDPRARARMPMETCAWTCDLRGTPPAHCPSSCDYFRSPRDCVHASRRSCA